MVLSRAAAAKNHLGYIFYGGNGTYYLASTELHENKLKMN